MSSRRFLALISLFVIAAVAARAHASPQVQGRLTLTGYLYSEHEQASGQYTLASPALLSFGDARAVISATGLFQNHLDMRLDLRVRATASADYERKFDLQPLNGAQLTATARGYVGGPEFDLREVWTSIWFDPKVALRLGRQLIVEADLLKIDGLLLRIDVGSHVRLLAFGGGAPNPYSRSLTTDYQAPCGSGVAVGNVACSGDAPIASFGGGLAMRYEFTRLFGSLGVAAASALAAGDGGSVVIDPTQNAGGGFPVLQPPDGLNDPPRVYIAWMNHVQPLAKLDLFSDLVVDVAGSQGAQLTRALLSGNYRLLRGDRLMLRFSYAFMSSQAINAFLNRQFYNRAPNGSTLADVAGISRGFVENNLTLLRTARHEARFDGQLVVVRKLLAYVEGRLRQRSLLNGESNPTVYTSNLYLDNQQTLAGDLTIGLRDRGSLSQDGGAGGLRSGLSYLLLFDYRAQSHILRASAGHPFFSRRLDIEVDYTLRLVRDFGADATACQAQLSPQLSPAGVAQTNPALSYFALDCFGRRSGATHEAGLTAVLLPWSRLQIYGDYHFGAMRSDDVAGQPVPTVFMHTAFLRIDLSL